MNRIAVLAVRLDSMLGFDAISYVPIIGNRVRLNISF